MTQDQDYNKLYFQEAFELLQLMNTNLLVIEKAPQNRPALDAIFRATHTLKGNSGSMGFDNIAALSHKMENILDKIRAGSLAASQEIIDLLFNSFDTLEGLVNSTQNGVPDQTNKDNLIRRLDAVAPQKTAERAFPVIPASAGKIELSPDEHKALTNAQDKNCGLFYIKVTLSKDCRLKSVRAFMVQKKLGAIGNIIKLFPDAKSLETEKFDDTFACLLATGQNRDAIKNEALDVLEIHDVAVDTFALSPDTHSPVAAEPPTKDTQNPPTATGQNTAPVQVKETLRKINNVRVGVDRLDALMNLVEELAISKLRLLEAGARHTDSNLRSVIEELRRLTDDLQTQIMQVRLIPVNQVFERYPRLVRDLAKSTGKAVQINITGGAIELDRTILDEIGEPLLHILRNAIDHGVETPADRMRAGKPELATITLAARREKNHVIIEVSEDGQGMDAKKIGDKAVEKGLITAEELCAMDEEQVFLLTTRAGFSTTEKVTDLSGRGVGLDVAKQKTESMGGVIHIRSQKGKGTTITLKLPITTAIVQALLVKIIDHIIAIPISNIIEIFKIKSDAIKLLEGNETLLHRDQIIPIMRFKDYFTRPQNQGTAGGVTPPVHNPDTNIVVVESSQRRFGIVVHQLVGQHEIVIKPLSHDLKTIRGFAGATILGDGNVALVLDTGSLI
ncbi:MAG: chemotaxis protein CheA [Deltaproteobacteria bacterium]|nr:chemotaxis protein CheA [Deltaproteobacteria bacterium]